jgi:hypothetical protein
VVDKPSEQGVCRRNVVRRYYERFHILPPSLFISIWSIQNFYQNVSICRVLWAPQFRFLEKKPSPAASGPVDPAAVVRRRVARLPIPVTTPTRRSQSSSREEDRAAMSYGVERIKEAEAGSRTSEEGASEHLDIARRSRPRGGAPAGSPPLLPCWPCLGAHACARCHRRTSGVR